MGTARARTNTSHKPVDPPPFDSRCLCILETKQVLCSALFIISHYLLVGRRPSACAFFAGRPRLYKGIDAKEHNARAPYVITALIKTITATHSLHPCGVVGRELFKPSPSGCFFFFLTNPTNPPRARGFDSNSAASIASNSASMCIYFHKLLGVLKAYCERFCSTYWQESVLQTSSIHCFFPLFLLLQCQT